MDHKKDFRCGKNTWMGQYFSKKKMIQICGNRIALPYVGSI